ncbi:MAG: hypothetical protein NWT08_05920 [Akkermansiaceae bacterium]|jgi:hypothetical protein|nr:hypothetical protein [Akkermansiaceae bacterium]MDP4645788.1 hypothetical protein [Akkermansiaceae bacterium]MDP4720091.1 hypothetical protein [Akkermansiaceae bacterium]MDP4779039.1 hypothetical protein [Akkermansiaceae bacterium]MDP4847957.1 hypothetical protein [Akkermansiaceae bacterium]
MTSPEQIVCKATPWFTLRAAAMLAMFGLFSVLFYIDGTTGYRKKNLEYYVHATFSQAGQIFSEKNKEGTLSASEWQEFAEKQTVKLPEASLLPADTELPMPWPAILTDFEKMKPLQSHLLWQEYSGENGMNVKPAEKAFDAGKIRAQIIVFWICLSLFLITLFFLIRTLGRSLKADDQALTVHGKRIPYMEMTTLDLRKWDTKGIALIDHASPSGSGRVRIDGLTYGGFKKEKDEPAERLMRKIRDNFSGELIEYTTGEDEEKTTESNENV